MSTCQECCWFDRPVRVGRINRTCSDLGEKPETDACDRFMSKPSEGDLYPEWVQEQVGALQNLPYRELFHEILAESFVLEQDAKLAVMGIQTQLQTQGAEVVLDEKEFDRSTSKLIDLYQTYRLICLLGLTRFRDEIMSAEIKRKFSPVIAAQSVQIPLKGSQS